jgi:hypothetical protein
MHQLAVMSSGRAAYFHSMLDGVHHSTFLFAADYYTFFWGFVLGYFFLEPDFTHSYPIHLPTLISFVPTLVPY